MQQSRPEKSRAQSRAVTLDDIRDLYEATRGAPEANQLLNINELFADPDKDYAKADEIIRSVLTRYERRHKRILRSKESRDDKRKQKAETTLVLFADVLERLKPIVRAQAARADAKKGPAEPTRSNQIDRSEDTRVSTRQSVDESVSESTVHTAAQARLSPEVQNLMSDYGSVSREVGHTRLVQDEKIIVEVGNIAVDVTSAGREFRHGKPSEAVKKTKQLASVFIKKVSQWEERAREKEKRGHTLSLEQKRKMEAEHHNVRKQYRLALKQFQRLLGALDRYEKENCSGDD